MCPQFLTGLSRQIARCNIEHRLAARHAFFRQAISCACVANEHAGRKFRIGIEVKLELNHVLMFPIMSRNTGTDYAAAVGQPLVIFVQFFLADEMHRRVVFIKVVGHGLDFLLNLSRISTFFEHHIALTGMFFPRGEFRIFTGTHSSQRLFYRHRVLAGIGYAFNAADGIGMALRYSTAPEGIVLTVRQDGVAVYAGKGEQARVPAYGNDAYMAVFLGSLIYIGKMLRNPCMGVEAVHHVKEFRIVRRLHRQVSSTAATENHDINFIFPFFHIADIDHGNAGRFYRQKCGVTAGKYRHQFQIIIGLYSAFHATAQITIT